MPTPPTPATSVIRPKGLSQPPSLGSPASEIAEVYVGAYHFTDWESVFVHVVWDDTIPQVRLVTTERDPIPGLWRSLQIRPGDLITVVLGGHPAMQAVVETRQTAYDAHSHAVSIQGVGIQWFTWRGAVGIQSKDQNYPGGFRDVATAVLAEFGKTPVFIGDVDNTEFKPPAHNNPGQSVFQFLKDLAVQRKVVLGSDHLGNLLFIGDHSGGIVDTLTEGKNIISCQCVIKIADLYQPYVVKAQTMRSDDGTPADAAMQKAERDSTVLRTYSPLLVVLPHPVWTQPEVELAVEAEREWGDGTFIEVTVVVYGWFTSHGVLWLQAVGQKVIFNSPMTTLVNESLAIKSATCTQDRESGSRTTLVLVAPWLLNDHGVRMSSVQPDPSKAATTKPTQDQQPADSTSSLQPNLLQPSGIQE